MSRTIEQVKAILCQTLKHLTPEDINDDAKLRDDLGLDSMSSLTFLITLESAFDHFDLSPETLREENLLTVKTVAAYVDHTQNMH